MIKIFLICITVIFISLQSSAQRAQDTLYLKNGRIITGKLHSRSDTQYEILTSDGFFHRFSSEDVEKVSIKGKPYVSSLNPALAKELKTIKRAKIYTGVGAGLGITGGILLIDDMNKRNNNTGILGNLPTGETAAGILILVGGIITEFIAIPIWIINSNKKKRIELEMVKFKSPGSASINGVGIRIRF
jgi:hypothetical protein